MKCVNCKEPKKEAVQILYGMGYCEEHKYTQQQIYDSWANQPRYFKGTNRDRELWDRFVKKHK